MRERRLGEAVEKLPGGGDDVHVGVPEEASWPSEEEAVLDG